VAAALYANRKRILRYTSRTSLARGVYCGMGVCFDCLVEIDGRPNLRACMTPVTDGMAVRTQIGPSDPVSPVPNWGNDDAD
jgi:predicted molibdopterin-dependent oxidoreductase YjgC